MARTSPINVSIRGEYQDADIKRAMADLQKLQATGQTMSQKMGAVGASMAAVGKKMTLGLTLPIVGVGAAATKMFLDFDSSMTKMVSLVGLSNEEVDSMRTTVKNMASQYGKSASEAANAMFFITSAGLRGSDAMETLEASLQASAVGLGEVEVIADLATSAMNAYGSDTLSAASATDVLGAAVREGKLEASQLAGSMGAVLPIASALGVRFDEVGAAFAAMSRTGTDASEAATQVRGIMSQIAKETPKGVKALASVGLTYDDLRSSLRERGLLATLETLKERFGGNTVATSAFFGNVRALTGVMDMLGSGSETTTEIFGRMTDTTGFMSDAFATAAETDAFKLQQSFATLKNSLIDFGAIIAPFVSSFASGLASVANFFGNLPGPIKNVTVALGFLVAAAGPVIMVAGKMLQAYAGAVAGMTRVNTFLRTSFAGTFASMKASVAAAVIQIKASMIAAQTQAGALAAGVRTAGVIAITSFKAIGTAAKGLMASMGPIGLGLAAITTAYAFMAGGADETKVSVDSLTDALRDQGDQGRETAAKLVAEDLYNKHGKTLEKLGLDYADAVTAVTGGTEAIETFRAKLLQTEEATTTAYGVTKLTKDAQVLVNEMARLGDTYTQADTKARGLEAATGGVSKAAGTAGNAMDGFGGSMDGAASEAAGLQVEVKKLSDIFTDMDANVAAIRAKDEFVKFIRGMDKALDDNNTKLLGNGKAAQDNRAVVLDALEKGKQDAVAWGEANGATLAQVETRFKKNTDTLKAELEAQGFKKKDIEKFFGSDYVDAAGVGVETKAKTAIGTLADRLGPVALAEFKGVGRALGDGLSAGVVASIPQLERDTSRAIISAEEAARRAAQSKSPSKLFAEVGKDLAKGLAQGVKSESDNLKETLRKTFTDWYDNALDGLRSKVKEARAVFKDFRAAISGQLTDSLDITGAYESLAAKQQAVDEARKAVNDARADLGDAPEQSALDKVNELQAAYDTAVAQAAANGGTLVGEFNAQAQGAVAFSEKMITLMHMGLDPALWQQIYDSGYEKGTGVVDNLIAGGVEGINASNDILNTVKAEADRIGLEAATKWKQSGIDSAKATVKGFVDRFGPDGAGRKRLNTLMTNLAESMKRETTITVTTINRMVNESVAGIKPDGKRATGGPVSAGKVYQVGEFGPELLMMGSTPGHIIPNTDLPMIRNGGGSGASGSMGSTPSIINLTVNAGMGTQGAEVGRQIVDALKAYERRNGSVYVSA